MICGCLRSLWLPALEAVTQHTWMPLSEKRPREAQAEAAALAVSGQQPMRWVQDGLLCEWGHEGSAWGENSSKIKGWRQCTQNGALTQGAGAHCFQSGPCRSVTLVSEHVLCFPGSLVLCCPFTQYEESWVWWPLRLLPALKSSDSLPYL